MMPAEEFADISSLAAPTQLLRGGLPLLESQWLAPTHPNLPIARNYWYDI
jgi:hypothetical protein